MSTPSETIVVTPPRAPYQAPVAGADPKIITKRVVRALNQLTADRTRILDKCDRYMRGDQDKPYTPVSASQETKMLAERSTTNWMPLVVGVPTQVSLVDGMRRNGDDFPKEFKLWDKQRMSSRQTRIYRSAMTYGQSFCALDLLDLKNIKLRSLSPLNTIAFYDDPGSDIFPRFLVSILERPFDKDNPGRVWYMDDEIQCELTYTADYGQDANIVVDWNTLVIHGLGETPAGRFTFDLDLEGRARGIVEMMMPLQDRINQTVFDLLVAQTYGAFKQRWAAGLEGEPAFDEAGNPIRDETGAQVFRPLQIDPKRIWASGDKDTKFGSLDETPLDGFISALETAVKQFAAISQVPPHALLGQMANLSAEALAAAESQLMRMVEMLHEQWGEVWEALFQLIARAMGIEGEEYSAQIRWRDMSAKTEGSVMDAMGKAATMLGVPQRGLWARIPNTTSADIERWEELKDEEEAKAMEANASVQFGKALAGESARRRPARRTDPQTPPLEQAA